MNPGKSAWTDTRLRHGLIGEWLQCGNGAFTLAARMIALREATGSCWAKAVHPVTLLQVSFVAESSQ